MQKQHKKTAKYFKDKRELIGLRKGKFARLIGISQSYASNIERGERGLPGRVMLEIE